jgi:hypothetical protein
MNSSLIIDEHVTNVLVNEKSGLTNYKSDSYMHAQVIISFEN